MLQPGAFASNTLRWAGSIKAQGAVFQATGRFHDPCYAREWEEPGAEADFTAVVDVLVRGLRA